MTAKSYRQNEIAKHVSITRPQKMDDGEERAEGVMPYLLGGWSGRKNRTGKWRGVNMEARSDRSKGCF